VVFVGLVVYAILASVNQRVSLFVIVIASLTVGNLLIPLQFACRRLYVAPPSRGTGSHFSRELRCASFPARLWNGVEL